MKPGFEDPLLKGHNGREFVAGSDIHGGILPTEPLRLEMTRDMSVDHLIKLLDGHVRDRVHREVPIDLDEEISGELAKSRRNHEGQNRRRREDKEEHLIKEGVGILGVGNGHILLEALGANGLSGLLLSKCHGPPNTESGLLIGQSLILVSSRCSVGGGGDLSLVASKGKPTKKMEIERREIKVWGSDYLIEKGDEDVDGQGYQVLCFLLALIQAK